MSEYLNRAIENTFVERLKPNKVTILFGARRVGKTMFLNQIIKNFIKEPLISLNGEDMATHALLEQRTVENYKRLMGNTKFLIIDEAQKVPDIGLKLKLMVDHLEGIKIIATGSSVFDISNKLGEPLTGRKTTLMLFPLAQMEYSTRENRFETHARLEERLIFGCYPELLSIPGSKDKALYLNDLVQSYLLKDILEFDGIRNSQKLYNLLRLIAFQIGKEVSLDEIGKQLSLSRNTVERYLDLLSKVFVIYRLPGFSRNLRTEVTKMSRWYFMDNGIRNALIGNFNPLEIRNDTGELWENYVLIERLKYQNYQTMLVNNYFWRTYQQQEIDWVEEMDGRLAAFEIKLNAGKTAKKPTAWVKAYPESSFQLINRENYIDWIV